MKSQTTRGSETASQRRVQFVGACFQRRDEEVDEECEEPFVRARGETGETPSVVVEERVVTMMNQEP
jgi:hypothetical protein